MMAAVQERDRVALVRFIESRSAMPHDWNGNCCVRFVLCAVEAQFGSAPAPSVTWTNERSAKRAIAKAGGIAAECDRLFVPITPAQAQMGDIAGIDDPESGFMLMIVEGATLAGPGETKLERRPRAVMVRAWRAGGPVHG